MAPEWREVKVNDKGISQRVTLPPYASVLMTVMS